MKRNILLLSLLFICIIGNATSITFYVKDGAWGAVKLNIYEDHFTSRKSLFAYQELDEKHSTVFQMENDKVQKLDIEVGRFTTSVFILPDETYEFYVYPYEQKIEVIKDDIKNTNDYVNKFHQDIKEYGADNIMINYALTEDELDNLEAFVDEINTKYKDTGGKFFDLHKRMSLQSFRMDIAKKTENEFTIDSLLDSLILRHKVIYESPAYMDFIKRWHYIKYYSFQFEFGADEYEDLKNIALGINNKEISQLLYLNAIEIAFKGACNSIDLVGDDLDSILFNPINEELEIIAYNLKQLYYKFSVGDPLPYLSLKDQHGTLFNVEDYQNQILYIGFWTQWNRTSVDQLKEINKIHKHFKDDVIFVSIMVDASFNTLNRFLEDKAYDWIFLSTGITHSMKEEFQLDRFPKYMIIGKDMKILEPVANAPSDDTLMELEMIIKSGN